MGAGDIALIDFEEGEIKIIAQSPIDEPGELELEPVLEEEPTLAGG